MSADVETAGKWLECRGFDLARAVNKRLLAMDDIAESEAATMTTRLQNIATRQSQSRARDLVFAAFVALAAVISVSSLSTAAHAARTQPVAQLVSR